MTIESGKTILLVEDEAIISIIASRALQKAGFKVITANSGEKAVALASADGTINLVLMDINLGAGIDGTEAARQILDIRNLPIVFHTSHSERELVEKVRGITRYGYIIKSSGDFVLQSTVEMAFELFESRCSNEKILKAMMESEAKFYSIFTQSPIGAVVVDLDKKFVRANNAFCKFTGYSESELIGKTIADITCPEDVEIGMSEMKQLAAGEIENSTVRKRYLRKDGTVIYGEISISVVRDENKKPLYFLPVIKDITGEKELEREIKSKNDEIKKRSRRFEQLIKSSSDSITVLDAEGNQLFVSDAVEQILGYKPEELVNIAVIQDMIHPDDQERTLNAFKEIIEKGKGGAEYRHKHKNGGWVYLEGWGTNQLDNPDIQGVVVNVRNVTARKQVEDEIKLDEARLESLLKINQHSTENIQNLLDFTLNEAIKLTGSKIGYIYFYDENKKEFALNTWSKEVMAQCAVVEKQTIYQLEKTGLWGEAVRQRQPIMVNNFEDPNPYKKGLPEGHNPLKKYLTIPVFSSEQIVAVVGVANKEIDYEDSDIRQLNLMMDAVWKIVQRKKTEDRVLKLLGEKELILKEVHHRIKNNMNTITNLLRIQADDYNNPEIKNVLFDAEGRVLSMMVLYDKLYRSNDFEELSIKDYLPALVDEILANFPGRMSVKIEKQIDDFILGVNILQPLGIIINELLTNSMKHAFDGRSGCLITISAKISGKTAVVVIQDNGKGMPESYDSDKPAGFGMQLVGILAQQIGGSVKIERGDGTRFVIEFGV